MVDKALNMKLIDSGLRIYTHFKRSELNILLSNTK